MDERENMTDQFKGISKQYVVKFEPGGERLIVNASNARIARQKGENIAAFLEIKSNGNTLAWLATEADLEHEDNVYPPPLAPEVIAEELQAQQEEE